MNIRSPMNRLLGGRGRAMSISVLGALAVLVASGVAMLATPSRSEARSSYALATGQSCGVCHVNPAGGGALTATGLAFQAVPTHKTDPAGAWAQISGSTPSPTPTAASLPPPESTSTPPPGDSSPPAPPPTGGSGKYQVLAWNDLGMHCYNRDFQDLALLPPANTLWAQVIEVADPPRVVTTGIRVEYYFEDNTTSAGKTNFWDYAAQLFGVDLPQDVGLKGKGLSGEMDLSGDHFVAEQIPLTEYSDSAPTTPDYYQLATVVVYDEATGAELARTNPVAPVSTEMHCDNCHKDGGVEDISTGKVETNILTLHDRENQEEYPAGHTGALMDNRPVLCAECHSSNALGAPGVAGIPSLSKAMHETHADKVPSGQAGCYQCHPGPDTQCQRDVMFKDYGMTCVDCHGTVAQVAQKSNPWLEEPRCDDCHSDVKQDQPLYRQSKGHGGVYCEACHDSPHAIAPSTRPEDAIKFNQLQGHDGPIDTCTVCHASQPAGSFPHNLGSQPVPTATPGPSPTSTPVAQPTSTPLPTAVKPTPTPGKGNRNSGGGHRSDDDHD